MRELLVWLGFDAQYLAPWAVIIGLIGLILVVVVIIIGIWAVYSGSVMAFKTMAMYRSRARSDAAAAALVTAKRDADISQFRASHERELQELEISIATRRVQLETSLAEANRQLVEATEGPIRAAKAAEQAAKADAESARRSAAAATSAAHEAQGLAQQAASRADLAEQSQKQAWLDLDAALRRQRELEDEVRRLTAELRAAESRVALDDRLTGIAANMAELTQAMQKRISDGESTATSVSRDR